MTEHPLTDEKALNLFSFERLIDTSEPISIEDAMRTASDWQLEQVNAWIDKNVHNYIDSDNLWTLVYMLKEDLNKAMRPTTTQENI